MLVAEVHLEAVDWDGFCQEKSGVCYERAMGS